MKKLLVFLMSLALCFAFAACSTPPAEEPETEIPVEDNTAADTTYTGKTFGITSSAFVDAISSYLAEKGRINIFETEPVVMETDKLGGPATTYGYVFAPGATVNISETKDTQQLVSIFILAQADSLSDDELRSLDSTILATVLAFSGNDEADAAIQSLKFLELDYSDTEGTFINFYTGKLASYSITYTDGALTFDVKPA